MEHLWAPWRNSYVTQKSPPDAELFAKIGQSTDDAANYVLARSKSCFAVLNAYPYNAGHLMIIPYRQLAQIEDLSEDEWLDMISLLKKMKAALTAVMNPHGFNVGFNLGTSAGAGVTSHIHLHLVPRWHNDVNFMGAIAETRIHPNDLAGIYKQITAKL